MNNPTTRTLLAILILMTAAPAQAQIFVPTEEGAALQAEASTSIGASWADYDDDGDLDVAVSDIGGIRVFRNDGGGTFLLVDVFEEVGNTYGTVWSDLDNDGDLDLALNSLNSGVWIYVNVGEGDLSPQPLNVSSAGGVRDISLMDIDQDGLVDIFTARRFVDPNQLLRNEGDLVFSDLADFAGLNDNSISGAWGDYDGDGDQDLYTTNTSYQPDRLYLNTGESLVLDSRPVLEADLELNRAGSSQSVNWVDVDRDGDLDLYVGDVLQRDKLYRNDGMSASGVSRFQRVRGGSVTEMLVSSLGSGWGDVDNDGDIDLVVTTKAGRSYVHINDGSGRFEGQALGNDAYGVSPTLIDYDADGDLDLFITNGGANFFEVNELFRNTTDGAKNWLQVRCVGTTSNRSGLGARVRIRSVIDGEATWQVQEVQARSGRQGQSGLRVHFGLDDAVVVDSLVVTWPSGVEQVLEDVAANQVLTIVEEGGAATSTEELATQAEKLIRIDAIHPNPFAGGTSIRVVIGQAGPVSVAVYDVLGRRVRTLLDRDVQPGRLDLAWDARGEGGERLASGTYFVRVVSPERRETAPITLVR